jgi:hypothetical protein
MHAVKFLLSVTCIKFFYSGLQPKWLMGLAVLICIGSKVLSSIFLVTQFAIPSLVVFLQRRGEYGVPELLVFICRLPREVIRIDKLPLNDA